MYSFQTQHHEVDIAAISSLRHTKCKTHAQTKRLFTLFPKPLYLYQVQVLMSKFQIIRFDFYDLLNYYEEVIINGR